MGPALVTESTPLPASTEDVPWGLAQVGPSLRDHLDRHRQFSDGETEAQMSRRLTQGPKSISVELSELHIRSKTFLPGSYSRAVDMNTPYCSPVLSQVIYRFLQHRPPTQKSTGLDWGKSSPLHSKGEILKYSRDGYWLKAPHCLSTVNT